MVGHEEQAVRDEDYSICVKTPTDAANKCVNDLRYGKKQRNGTFAIILVF
jgi:hypothetical protein